MDDKPTRREDPDDDRGAPLPGYPDFAGGGGILLVCPRHDYSVMVEYIPDPPRLCPNDNTALVRFDG